MERLWRGLPAYDRKDVDGWLERVVPTVLTAQRASASLVDAFIALSLERQPLGIDTEKLVGAAVRSGTSPEVVYSRPFVNVWSALGNGTAYEDAVASGLARAKSAAAMDTQLSMRAAAGAVQAADDGIFGYQRVADSGACEFCSMIDGAYVKFADASPLHPNCGCGLEPLTAPHPRAAKLPSGVAVHEHGELGPVLTSPDFNFTTEAQALA